MDTHLIGLQGRILAQEMLMRALLTGTLATEPEPFAALDQVRRDFRATMQYGDRPTGEYEDAVWEAAVKALEAELGAVEARLKEQSAG